MCIFSVFQTLQRYEKNGFLLYFSVCFFVCDAIFFLAVAKRKRAYIPCGVCALFFGYVVCLCG